MEQGKFMGLLAELLEFATVRDNRVAKTEIDQWFEELSLNQEQLELVYRYLEENQVRIAGLGEKTDSEQTTAGGEMSGTRLHGGRSVREVFRAGGKKKKPSGDTDNQNRVPEEENRYYKMYLSDLKAVSPCTVEEMALLMPRVLKGELEAADRLAEGNLHRVAEWARPFMGRGVVISDLIQEGNMILMEEIHLLKSQYPRLDVEDFLYILKKKSETAMAEAIRQQESHRSVGEKVASRANRIMDLTEEIAREHGTQATVEQLAELLHITEEEVRDIMKISLDVINLAKVSGNPTAFEPSE